MNGQSVSFECVPSHDNIELYWTYQTNTGKSIVTTTNISQSKFLTESLLLHQLTLPVATVSDTGNYTCIVQASSGNNVMISQTISLTVLPGMIYIICMHNIIAMFTHT